MGVDPQLQAYVDAFEQASGQLNAASNAPMNQFYVDVTGLWVCWGNPAQSGSRNFRNNPRLYQSTTAVVDANALNAIMVASVNAVLSTNIKTANTAANNALNNLAAYAPTVPIMANPPAPTVNLAPVVVSV